jgi:hypothetical protein
MANRLKSYLVQVLGINADRVVTIDGGIELCLTQELWVVPIGATPKIRDDASTEPLIDGSQKFDEYYFPLPTDSSEGSEDDAYSMDSFEAFTTALQRRPHTQAYIIVYAQYYIERIDVSEEGKPFKIEQHVHLDRPNAFLKMSKSVKADLVNKYRIAPSRIRIVNGGYRKVRHMELWIVPRGEHAPIATPNAFPKKRR